MSYFAGEKTEIKTASPIITANILNLFLFSKLVIFSVIITKFNNLQLFEIYCNNSLILLFAAFLLKKGQKPNSP